MEYGIESTDDKTLCRINRGHTFHAAADAVERNRFTRNPDRWACHPRTAAGTHESIVVQAGVLSRLPLTTLKMHQLQLIRGTRMALEYRQHPEDFTRNPDRWHVILGLPGETHESIVVQAGVLSRLPLTTLKMHQLQLIRGTRMALEYRQHPEDFHLFGVDEYIDLVIDYIEHLRPDLVLERFVSQSPKELLIAPDWGLKIMNLIIGFKRMKELGAYQGKKYEM